MSFDPMHFTAPGGVIYYIIWDNVVQKQNAAFNAR